MKKWKLPAQFKTIYWQNFMLTAGVVMLTLTILGASFFALSYGYALDERSDEMREKVETVSDQWALKTVWGVGYKFEVK